MHWFIDPIKNHYADFDGRVGRQEYWMFFLCNFLLGFALGIIGVDTLAMLVQLALIVPSLAIAARRLHDTGRSGWWQLLIFIPIIGWIILLVWLATKTDDQDNQYGKPAVPKTGPEGVIPVAAAPVAPTQADSAMPMATTTDSRTDTKADTTTDTSADSAPSADGGSGSSSD